MENKTIEERIALADKFKQEALLRISYSQQGFKDGFSARKELEQKILTDMSNKYKSWLQQETQSKMGRGNPNLIRETELRAKIDLLIELKNKLK